MRRFRWTGKIRKNPGCPLDAQIICVRLHRSGVNRSPVVIGSTLGASGHVGVLYLGAIGFAGTGPRPAQVSQISWPRCTLLGVAVHACPAAQMSGTGVVVPR
jgi:hypothetical protein